MKIECVSFRSSIVNGKLSAEVFSFNGQGPEFDEADVNLIRYENGNWVQDLPQEVEVNKLTEHLGEWSRDAGYEIRYR